MPDFNPYSENPCNTIKERLFEQGWFLCFQPRLKIIGNKPISFNEDGSIGEGRNMSEHFWRWDSDILEIIRIDNVVNNKFNYVPALNRFISNQQAVTYNVTGQYIYKDTSTD